MGLLDGKVAVITGAGSGMAKASTKVFVREGARVVAADISGAEKDTAAEVGEGVLPVHCDVTKEADVAAMIDAAVQEFGRVDAVLNVAGIGQATPITDVAMEDYDRIMDVDLRGVLLGMKYGIRAMLRNGGGSIVSTASAAGLVGWKGHSVYGAAKAGVIQLTKAAALDYAEENIRVNAICPGMFWTGLVQGARDSGTVGQQPPADSYPPPKNVPMARWGLASEIATAALFLASDDSSFITGVALPVDGGFVCP
jgi:NAD(P)-dependent dehydrogenase (short-subunit alcohol dehydrogenase family)